MSGSLDPVKYGGAPPEISAVVLDPGLPGHAVSDNDAGVTAGQLGFGGEKVEQSPPPLPPPPVVSVPSTLEIVAVMKLFAASLMVNVSSATQPLVIAVKLPPLL
jgi:hypothetical protein